MASSESNESPSKIPKIDQSSSSGPNSSNNDKGKKDWKPQTRKEKWQKKDAKFHYGNYDRYYGKREAFKNDEKKSEFDDPRLKIMKSEWFAGKKVLDIGCNVGFVTTAIGELFSPSSIVGLDIDENLIRSAKNILRKKIAQLDGTGDEKKDGGKPEKPISRIETKLADMERAKNMEKVSLLKKVQFESGNYVLSDDSLLDCVRPEYDVVLALSLTKWIHLNWGDDGMKRFFRRVYRHLNPGGIFLLEPQPWSTYKKRSSLTPEIMHNYNNIQFKPDRFRSFLLSEEIGFESCEAVNKTESEAKGFSRPIFLFRKPNENAASGQSETPPNGDASVVEKPAATEEKGDGKQERADEVNEAGVTSEVKGD